MIALFLAAALAGELDGPGLAKVVASHRGQVVLVTLWATWCAPCVEELPAIVALAKERKDLAVVSLSIDDREDRKALEAFLRSKDLPFPVYARASIPDEDFINGIDPAWRGVVPATIIFGPGGKKVALLQGEHSRADIEKALAKAAK